MKYSARRARLSVRLLKENQTMKKTYAYAQLLACALKTKKRMPRLLPHLNQNCLLAITKEQMHCLLRARHYGTEKIIRVGIQKKAHWKELSRFSPSTYQIAETQRAGKADHLASLSLCFAV
mmetsp:Transcript_73716/g.116750  ORF Transcript_73716/g.116750 Transcript_73716/m.116750 type:complete len:121 (+) Transcript_73716:2486-2848(+)